MESCHKRICASTSLAGSAIMRAPSSAKARAMLWGSAIVKPWSAPWRSAKVSTRRWLRSASAAHLRASSAGSGVE